MRTASAYRLGWFRSTDRAATTTWACSVARRVTGRAATAVVGAEPARGGAPRRRLRTGRPEPGHDRVVVQVPGDGHDHVAREVVLVEEGADPLGRHGRHR